jgi:hypothetical protein
MLAARAAGAEARRNPPWHRLVRRITRGAGVDRQSQSLGRVNSPYKQTKKGWR